MTILNKKFWRNVKSEIKYHSITISGIPFQTFYFFECIAAKVSRSPEGRVEVREPGCEDAAGGFEGDVISYAEAVPPPPLLTDGLIRRLWPCYCWATVLSLVLDGAIVDKLI